MSSPHVTTLVDTRRYKFIQLHRIYNTKSEPYCKLGLWIPLWWETLIMGKTMHVWRQGYVGNLCSFCLELLWT